MDLATASPLVIALLCVFSGLSVIALGELFLAVRENTLNNRRALTEDRRQFRYDYGGLHVVGWINIAIGALVVATGAFLFFYPLFH